MTESGGQRRWAGGVPRCPLSVLSVAGPGVELRNVMARKAVTIAATLAVAS